MPHVIVKIYAGRAEAQKQALADEITQAVIKTLGYGDDAVSVSIEDVAPEGLGRESVSARHRRQARAALQDGRSPQWPV
jgi:4-oxalocrotonate tautomerase family enzyme